MSLDLGQAMRAWEEMRDELEKKIRATFTASQIANVPTRAHWAETRAKLEAQLSAVAMALDMCRDPNGPIRRRSIEDLVRERQALITAGHNLLEGYELDITTRFHAGMDELRQAIAKAHDSNKPTEQEELF